MIKTEREWNAMRAQLEVEDKRLAEQRQLLVDAGLSDKQLEAAMAPLISFRDQLAEEIEFYERIKAKDFSALSNFESIGRLLIALRIASGRTQHDLAVALQMDDAQISRYERDEYYGLTVPKIIQVLKALGFRIKMGVEPLDEPRDGGRIPA
ncbi:MAG: helix-turn-helix domain-containing protein [Candidatus Sericytochromatia bacterium]|nr:helix-turn-helix domain-containing protein [Candidatus Tanganyikabacteria bacterium]